MAEYCPDIELKEDTLFDWLLTEPPLFMPFIDWKDRERFVGQPKTRPEVELQDEVPRPDLDCEVWRDVYPCCCADSLLLLDCIRLRDDDDNDDESVEKVYERVGQVDCIISEEVSGQVKNEDASLLVVVDKFLVDKEDPLLFGAEDEESSFVLRSQVDEE